MRLNRTTAIGYSVSLFFHAVLLTLLPGIGELKPKLTPKWMEVELFQPEPETPVTTQAMQQKANGSKNQDAPDQNPKIGDSPMFPAPPINLPSRLETLDIKPPDSALPLPGAVKPEIIGSGSSLPGLPEGDTGSSDRSGTNIAGSPPAFNWMPDEHPVAVAEKSSTVDFPIEGPLARRHVIYRPPPPKTVALVSGTVKIKFWVLPDGTVGKMIPIVRGDPDLERRALKFLSKWRFEKTNSAARDQWGILSIRFKVK